MLITLLLIIILIYSAVLHEYAHGWMARRLGDDTAERAGRLTLNPIPHLDLFGSIILPAMLLILHSPYFLAWAKPVPYNPNNLSDRKFGELKVAIAGPVTNFIIALFFGLVVRFIPLAATTKFQLIGVLLGNTDSLSLVL
jgi:Zn-dependent protease